MTLNYSMSITPSPSGQAKRVRFEHGSVLGGKTRAAWVSSQWKSTVSRNKYEFGARVMRNRDGSWETFDDYVLDFALDRISAGEKIALVTLARIEGSSPRPLGAQMAVSETGRWVGYLSG